MADRKEYFRKWRAENKEKALEYGRKWKRNNKEKVAESAKRYAKENPEVLKRNQENYLSRHPEKRKETAKRWWEKNPEKAREYYENRSEESIERKREASRRWYQNPDNDRKHTLKRRARKTNTIVELSAEEEKEILSAGCFFADETCKGRLTLAHDIPVSKGGNTVRANVFCLCQKHNSQMHTKTLGEMIKQLLFPF